MAAMVVHAAGESSPGNLNEGTFAFVLAVPGERELVEVASRLRGADIAFVEVHEPDAPHDNALMAIGVKPVRKEALRKHLSSLPLLK